jgi:hypothetical protein
MSVVIFMGNDYHKQITFCRRFRQMNFGVRGQVRALELGDMSPHSKSGRCLERRVIAIHPQSAINLPC